MDFENSDTGALLKLVNKIAPKFNTSPNDIQFLKQFLESNDFKNLLKIHDTIRDSSHSPASTSSKTLTLAHMVSYDLENNSSSESKELYQLLTSVNMHSLILAYDKIANKDYPPVPIKPDDVKKQDEEEAVLIVRVDKENEPLGATVKSDIAGNILISRVIHGTVADRCGLLRVGDVIHEINGESIHGKTIDEIADEMLKLNGTIVFKLSPCQEDCRPRRRNKTVTYVRALFSYDPSDDIELPCVEAGLAFEKGDILAIFNKEDPNWWQASNEKQFRAGLIPGTKMREKSEFRNTLKSSANKPQRKRKIKKAEYSPLDCEEQGGHEIVTYEEVVMMKPQTMHPRPIVLIAPNCEPFFIHGIKTRLIQSSPQRYGEPILHTSRPPKPEEQNGQNFHFVTKEEMARFRYSNRFIDYIEFDGYQIGLAINSVINVTISGKICILTLSPKVLKLVHLNTEIKPYVIFFKPPTGDRLNQAWVETGLLQETQLNSVMELSNDMECHYGQYFDQTVEYDNVDQATVQVQRIVEKVLTEPQWVPATWSLSIDTYIH